MFGVDIVVAEGRCDVGDIVVYGVVVYCVAIDDEAVDGAGGCRVKVEVRTVGSENPKRGKSVLEQIKSQLNTR